MAEFDLLAEGGDGPEDGFTDDAVVRPRGFDFMIGFGRLGALVTAIVHGSPFRIRR